MKGWSFAFSPRWLGYLALVVSFATACVFLSNWQLDRSAQARAEIERVEANWPAPPAALEEVLPRADEFDAALTWRPVLLEGRYLEKEQLLVRGRPYDSRAGFDVLVPFQTRAGDILVIDRGWVPVGNSQDAPDFLPDPPSGEVTVVARLRASEPTIPGRSAPEGQVATINLPAVAEQLDLALYTGAYGQLDSEDPAPAERPLAYPRPVADGGPHLSYALQWVAFGVLAFIGLAWAIRHEYRVRNGDDPRVRQRESLRGARAAAKGPTDAEIEDAILDRQSAARE